MRRYTREVLNCLAAVGLIQLEPGTGTAECPEAKFWVPEADREPLTKYGLQCGVGGIQAIRFGQLNNILKKEDIKNRFSSAVIIKINNN